MNYKISVVMTTYNGERYIIRQLLSVMNQTRKPDQVVIFDDRSTDNTVRLIEQFIADNKLENWSITVNDQNLGWMQNFYEASKHAIGDIIFFSDQDDMWISNKIELMSGILAEKNAGCVYGEYIIVDEHDEIVESRNINKKFTDEVTQEVFDKGFYARTYLGCRMCISREILDLYLKIGVPENGHDSQCARLALLFSSLWRVNTPVIKYRIHSNNTSGVDIEGSYGYTNPQKRIDAIKSNERWLAALVAQPGLDSEQRDLCHRLCSFQELRLQYLQTNNVHFSLLLKNRELYRDFTMLVGDFAYKHRINKTLGSIKWKATKFIKRNYTWK